MIPPLSPPYEATMELFNNFVVVGNVGHPKQKKLVGEVIRRSAVLGPQRWYGQNLDGQVDGWAPIPGPSVSRLRSGTANQSKLPQLLQATQL